MTRGTRGTPAPVLLSGLELLTSTDGGIVRLPGLALTATAEAITVTGPAQQVLRSWEWSEVDGIGGDADAMGSDGITRQVLELSAANRRHRFIVAAADLSVFLTATADWRRPGGAVSGLAQAGLSGRQRATHRAPGRRARGRAGRTTKWRRHGLARHGLARHGLVRHGLVRASAPRHARLLRLRPVSTCVGAALLIAGGATVATLGGTSRAQADNPSGAGSGVSIMSDMAREYAHRALAVDLPAATTAPAPAPPSLAGSPALQTHEIFGFAPYWTLPQSAAFDVADLTTIAYFSVGVNGDGTVQMSGPGWNGYQSQDLADLITRAHAAGSRVVLTVTCFGQSALNQLTSDPTAAKTLSASLIPLISAKNMDGVNFDFEGQGPGDQAGLDSLIALVSTALRGADPHWQVTMDTYASSAGDPGGFYDIAGLAPSVDAFFVMAYDMNGTQPSPTAALTGAGFTDQEALQQYTAVVPASKVILGVPYYGYDWPTTGPDIGATATGPKTPLSYSVIAAAGHPVYWDPTTQTAWTSYQVGDQWHQTWYDDPTSLALKAQLAGTFHIAGLGVWALGMDGNAPTMLAALLGNAPVVKDYLPGPTTAGAGTTTTTTYQYAGVWNGGPVALAPVGLTALPDNGEGTPAGVLSGFSTDDPTFACLAAADATLPVSELVGEPGVFVVTAQTPADCVNGSFTFSGPAGAGGSGGGSGTGDGSGSSTTTTTTTTSTTTTSTPTTTTTTTTIPTS